MPSNSNISEEEAKKIQEEKEKLLNEIKNNFTTPDTSDSNAESSNIETNTNTSPDVVNSINVDTADSDDPISNKTDALPNTSDMMDSMDDLEDMDNSIPKKRSTTMPKYGKGFKFVPIVSGFTVLCLILGHIKPFNIGVSHFAPLRYTYIGLGILSAVFGLFIFVEAISSADILTNAQMGKLVTTGIYSKTRNPMYAGVIFMCTGALFCSGNIYMYLFPLIYWWLLGVMMKNTEEPMLLKNFGDEYKEYYNNTNRFVPVKKR